VSEPIANMELLLIETAAGYLGIDRERLTPSLRIADDLSLDSMDVIVLLEEMSAMSGRSLNLSATESDGHETPHLGLTLGGLAAHIQDRPEHPAGASGVSPRAD